MTMSNYIVGILFSIFYYITKLCMDFINCQIQYFNYMAYNRYMSIYSYYIIEYYDKV